MLDNSCSVYVGRIVAGCCGLWHAASGVPDLEFADFAVADQTQAPSPPADSRGCSSVGGAKLAKHATGRATDPEKGHRPWGIGLWT